MPPRKKSNSSSSSTSKKSNPQPSKYGIQHFFDRHSLITSQKHQPDNATTQVVSEKPNDREVPPQNTTPPDNLVLPAANAAETPSDVSPEISKSVSLKRFKFSPGMFIKQSQDDGADEVTWKISPMNERLQAVSKYSPKIIQALADSSRINLLPIHRCTEDKTSLDKEGNVEKLLSAKAPTSMSKLGLRQLNPDRDVNFNGKMTTMSNTGVANGRSPFRTPPSLSYRVDKLAKDVEHNGPSDPPFLRQHKKALLDLLDQVEDVIAVDNGTPCNETTSSFNSEVVNSNVLPIRFNNSVETTKSRIPKEVVGNSSYLVLEVSENCQPTDSSAALRPCKVLRLLDEQFGEERVVHLWDEWSDTVISPGDTVNIIGQFDEGGNCDIDHDNNFLIVHPDTLVSGTRVAASFSCPRRTVLDERLKSNEYSTIALCGTLLHQIFEAGLTKDNPTVEFLENYTKVVLQRNIESLFACGVNESDVLKTLIDAIPRIINWIMVFKNMEEREGPEVNFGCVEGMKKVGISEVIDIEEMAWAPKYGLKGMIDASVRVKIQSRKDEPEKIMPVEFKTGKPPNGQSSNEHSAQVILYTLLMSERALRFKDPT